MPDICPLVFEPILRRKPWGARNLERIFGKRLPPGERIGESWEVADLEVGQSTVARGPAKGATLTALVSEWGEALLGRSALIDGRFPLLIKFLDAAENLSIQVHPDEATARRQGGAVREKHEAWHIIDARPDSCIYRGLAAGVTIDDVRSTALQRPAEVVSLLNRIPVKAGQTYYLPSGTPHAIGAGIVVAEIQTPSDVTYRLYDWNRQREGPDAGLHIASAIECIRSDSDFSRFEKRSHVTSLFTTVTRLLRCPSFNIEKVRFIGELEQEIPYAEMVCWIVTQGRGEILYDRNGRFEFIAGDVVILPAALPKGRLRTQTDCAWLEVTCPIDSDLAAFPRPSRDDLNPPPSATDRTIPLKISIKKDS